MSTSLRQSIELHLKAHIAVVHVAGYEEAWILRELAAMAKEPGWPEGMGIFAWDVADQASTVIEGSVRFEPGASATIDKLLWLLDDFKGPAMFVVRDAQVLWPPSPGSKVSNVRKIRNIAARWPSVQPQKILVLLTPEDKLPEELKHDVVNLDCPKPDRGDMAALLRRVVPREALAGVRPELCEKVEEAALGLSCVQAERVFRKAIVGSRTGRLDEKCLDQIRDEKCRIIKQSGALELHTHTEPEENIGGLEELKRWIQIHAKGFSIEAKAYPLDIPRGLMLVGIPGTGKSLCARLLAGQWKFPLLRLDMGAVFGGLVGASERNIREAIAITELIAPSILWVDEIEKGFAGAESSGDSGTSSRVLATFLTWMAEKKAPVFVFATANDIFRLPPEFPRKGRFDEVFFLDLPTDEERVAILKAHLRKRGYRLPTSQFDLKGVAEATKGFVGAEIEAVVKDAMFLAFNESSRQLTTSDLLKSAGDMVPLARSHADRIEKLRQIVKSGQARNASTARDEEAVKTDEIRTNRLIDLP